MYEEHQLERFKTLSRVSSGACRNENLLSSLYITQLHLSFDSAIFINELGGVGRMQRGGREESSCWEDETDVLCLQGVSFLCAALWALHSDLGFYSLH